MPNKVRSYMATSGLIWIVPTVLLAALFSATACRQMATDRNANNTAVFAPSDVCGYPAGVSAKIFHNLGGGKWTRVEAGNVDTGFECSGALTQIQLFGSADAAINVGYSAVGNERGAQMITLDYMGDGPGRLENESTYRNVYLNFVNDIVRQSLRESVPDLVKKKISNLESYYRSGQAADEYFPVGDGFIILVRSRDPDGQAIKVTVRVYPDKALRLDAARP